MRLLLVTGCPRSGTTAVASWLGSAPGVRAANESRRTIALRATWRAARRFWCFDDAPQAANTGRATSLDSVKKTILQGTALMYGVGLSEDVVVVDKEPLEPVAFPEEDYSAYLQDVREIWNADLVCMVRNPTDTIASMTRRNWGYSVRDLTPHPLTVQSCIRIWKKATRAVVRMKVVHPDNTRLQTYESLTQFPEVVREELRKWTGLSLGDFAPRPARHGDFDLHVVEETAWERQILTAYDDRPLCAPRVVLLTGEPGTGKTTIANEVARVLGPDRMRVVVLDGDDMRRRLWPELGYDVAGRAESTRRALALATSISFAGAIVLVAMVAPYDDVRMRACEEASRAGITVRIVQVSAPSEVRLKRRPDVPGANIHDVSYEAPSAPNVVIDTSMTNLTDSAAAVLKLL